jgi:hypothetical protein
MRGSRNRSREVRHPAGWSPVERRSAVAHTVGHRRGHRQVVCSAGNRPVATYVSLRVCTSVCSTVSGLSALARARRVRGPGATGDDETAPRELAAPADVVQSGAGAVVLPGVYVLAGAAVGESLPADGGDESVHVQSSLGRTDERDVRPRTPLSLPGPTDSTIRSATRGPWVPSGSSTWTRSPDS